MTALKQFIKTTWWVMKIYWKIAPSLSFVLFATQLFLELQTLFIAYITGRAIDMIIQLATNKTASVNELLPIIFIFVGLSFIGDFVRLVNNRVGSMLSRKDIWKLRGLLSEKLVELGISQLENPELTNKATRFQEVIGSLTGHVQMVLGLFSIFIAAIISGLVVVKYTPQLVIAIFIFFLIKFFINQKYINKLWNEMLSSTENRRSASANINAISDPVTLKELLLTGGVYYIRKKYRDFVVGYIEVFRHIYWDWARFEFLEDIGDAILYAIGLYLILTKSINLGFTVGTITFLMRSFGNFADQMDTLSYRISGVRESSVRIQDVQEVFEKYKAEDDGYKVVQGKLPSSISLTNVSFSYPSNQREIFKNLNLHIKPGEKVAIVGENGAGKTTLVKLIARVYRPTNGDVEIDGINLNEIKIQSWYQKLGLLFQDYNTYDNLSVLENVGIGNYRKRRFSSRHVVEALNKAEALDFVQLYKRGLNQILSERYKHGIRPSTGQWQKIALARFFYRNAPVLILDEPTASIDAVSEAKIFDNVYKFMQGKTVIIISHRFSTVRNADRILVLDNGKIIEDGTHEELLKLKGKYAHAFKLQAEGYN